MNPWITIVAQYGLEFAIEFAKAINDPKAQDFAALGVKYGTKSPETYLQEAKARAEAKGEKGSS